MVKLKRFKQIPTSNGFIKKDYVFETKAIQDEKTGLMQGRVETTRHDWTPVKRVHKEFQVGNEIYEPGEIIGRFKKEEGIKYAKKHHLPLKQQSRKNQKAYWAKRGRR